MGYDFSKMKKEELDELLLKAFGSLPNYEIVKQEKHGIDIVIK